MYWCSRLTLTYEDNVVLDLLDYIAYIVCGLMKVITSTCAANQHLAPDTVLCPKVSLGEAVSWILLWVTNQKTGWSAREQSICGTMPVLLPSHVVWSIEFYCCSGSCMLTIMGYMNYSQCQTNRE